MLNYDMQGIKIKLSETTSKPKQKSKSKFGVINYFLIATVVMIIIGIISGVMGG